MFQTIEAAPPDAILGLTETFRADPNPNKVNLSVGQYKNAAGETPALDCVKRAEHHLLEKENSKAYLPIDGLPEYCQRVQQLLLGADLQGLSPARLATIQTPGGTGALRVAADFLNRIAPGKRVWLSQPTWPNHPNIFSAAGLETGQYDYFDPASNGVDFAAMTRSLEKIPAGEIVVLHACCHNPTGADLDARQWRTVGEIIKTRRLMPLVDFAYQGFSDGIEDDATGLRHLCRELDELLICNSFSKNFGLYRERTGALTMMAKSATETSAILSRAKQVIRCNYSNPPAHGAAVVATILDQPELRDLWIEELAEMRGRIKRLRSSFADTMNQLQKQRDFSFINQQNGMFSFSGLDGEQVDRLREKHSIYIVRSGRINVAGLKEVLIPVVCQAIASVL